MRLKRLLLAPKRLHHLRSKFHASLYANVLGHEADQQVHPNTDSAVDWSLALFECMSTKTAHEAFINPKNSSAAEPLLKQCTLKFLRDALDEIGLDGSGAFLLSVNDAVKSMTRFEDYKAFAKLVKQLDKEADLRTSLGGDYLITPDLTVARKSLNC